MRYTVTKIYIGASYKLWGAVLHLANGNSYEIENITKENKRLKNEDFLNELDKLAGLSYENN